MSNELPRHATALPLTAADRLSGLTPFRLPAGSPGTQLRLDANEGPAPAAPFAASLRAAFDAQLAIVARRYPTITRDLETDLAASLGISPDRVIITAGADEALWRLCNAFLQPGRTAITADPTFEMIPRYIQFSGARHLGVPWDPWTANGEFPLDAFAGAITASATSGAVAFLVSPNNPTGVAAPRSVLRSAANLAQRSGSMLVFDRAYGEFADDDPFAESLTLPAVVTVGTFSKAWGLAGLRVGYAIVPQSRPDWADALRTAGSVFSISGVSAALARAALRPDSGGREAMAAHVAAVRTSRSQLASALAALAVRTPPPQGNFVFAQFGRPRAHQVADRLAAANIIVKRFPATSPLADCLRITAPADHSELSQLVAALQRAVAAVSTGA